MAKNEQTHTRWIKFAVWVCVLLLSLGVLFGRNYQARGDIPTPLKWVTAPFVALEKIIHKVGRTPQELSQYFRDQGELIRSVESKSKAIQELEIKLQLASETKQELIRAKKLLALAVPLQKKLVFAEVYAKRSLQGFQILSINRGTKHKLEVGFPVVAPDGVVGRIMRTGILESTVLPLLDPNSRVDVLNERTGSRAVVLGRGLRYLEYEKNIDADIKVGDRLLTSGLLGFFPPFLSVGSVKSVDLSRNKIKKIVRVEPAVPFSALRYLAVIRSKSFAVSKGFLQDSQGVRF
jgi:rod shape-determining protein MreC